MNSLTRLQLNDVVVLGGRKFVVRMVNDCRARCVPVARKVVTLNPATGPNAGRPVTFTRHEDAISISPNSEIEVVGQWKGNQKADL